MMDIVSFATKDHFGPTESLRFLRIEELWQQGLTGKGIAVGHLDTGLMADHPALDRRVAAFACIDDQVAKPSKDPIDEESHGTHTASLICGGRVEGWDIGVAPDARLHAAAVLDGGNNLVRALLGMDWLRGSGIRVLYFPMGVPGYHPVFYTMLEVLRSEGALPICPIGNGGVDGFHAPGIYPNVLSVGAVNEYGLVAPLSGCFRQVQAGRCLKPEILAPGVKVVSANSYMNPPLRAENGTSQAAALVAGVAALLFQAKPEATPTEVERALIAGCEPLHGADARRSQFGIVNPCRSLELLRNSTKADVPPRKSVTLPHKYIDDTLREACLSHPASASVESIIVVTAETAFEDERGPAGLVVDRLQAKLGETVSLVRYLPHARLAMIRASRHFTWQIALDEAVSVASACRARDRPRHLQGLW